MDLSSFRVKNAPSTVYYIPDFISGEEETMLLSHVYRAPRTKWTVLSHRRLQNWGGLPTPKGMVAEDLPQWLSDYGQKIANLGAFEGKVPNHVLVNEYKPGQGIMPHEDGPAFYPTVSTISLGSHAVLDFYYHLDTVTDTSLNTIPDTATDTQHGTAASRGPQPGHGTPDGVGLNPALLSTSATSSQTQAVDGSEGHSSEGKDHREAQNSEGSRQAEKERENAGAADKENTSMDNRHFLSLLIQPRSLLLLQDDMYKVHLHGIKEVTQDSVTDKVVNLDLVPEVKVGDALERGTRVSLTIRYVPKVLKSKLILGKR